MSDKVGISIQNKSVKCQDLPSTIFEKDACITVNGNTDSYEVVKVYSRDAVTGISTLLHYETKQGAIITGTIEEVCCDCKSLCDFVTAIVPQPNRKCYGYASNQDPNLSNSGWMMAARHNPAFWTGNCGAPSTTFTWELMSCIVNGVEQLTAPVAVTVPFSSMTLTAAGIPTNYATAFNALPVFLSNDIVLEPDMVNHSYNTTKPYALGFRQYSSDAICSNANGTRMEVIKSGVGDAISIYATANTFASYSARILQVYNDATNEGFNQGLCITL